MITTLEQVKLTNQISVSTYDDAINAQIPIVAELVFQYTRDSNISTNEGINNFNGDFYNYRGRSRRDTTKGYEVWTSPNVSASGEFVFDSDAKTITSLSAVFVDFIAGDDIVIYNSMRNSGYLTIASLTSTVLTVTEDIKSETDNVDIYMVDYPKSVSYIASLMVGWDVKKRKKAMGADSERIGTHSVKYKSIGGSMYPLDIVNGLKRFHKGK